MANEKFRKYSTDMLLDELSLREQTDEEECLYMGLMSTETEEIRDEVARRREAERDEEPVLA